MKTNAIVLQNIRWSPELFMLRVKPDGWAIPAFLPGQYVAIGLSSVEQDPAAKMIARAYSVASAPQDSALEFYVALVKDGHLTPRLYTLTAGDRLWVASKFTGKFTLESVPAEANVVLIATGTGLAPYISMLRSGALLNGKRHVAVIHGVRYVRELGYRAELEELTSAADKRFAYLPVVSRSALEGVEWKGLTGHVQNVWKSGAIQTVGGFRPDPSHTHIFLCGNPAMIESAGKLLTDEGYAELTPRTPGQVHIERYW